MVVYFNLGLNTHLNGSRAIRIIWEKSRDIHVHIKVVAAFVIIELFSLPIITRHHEVGLDISQKILFLHTSLPSET